MGKINNSPGPVKKIMYLSAAYEYQHLYIAQQFGLCPNVPIMPIKTIAENSGMTVRKPTYSKTDRRSGSENVVVTETSYQMEEVLSFCYMKRALTLSIK